MADCHSSRGSEYTILLAPKWLVISCDDVVVWKCTLNSLPNVATMYFLLFVVYMYICTYISSGATFFTDPSFKLVITQELILMAVDFFFV